MTLDVALGSGSASVQPALVNPDKPSLSETGYRSFLGVYAAPQAGFQKDVFAAKVIVGYVERELGARLLAIGAEYRERKG